MAERITEPWMCLPQSTINGLNEDDWKHYKNKGCVCAAHCDNECCCGAWSVTLD